MIRNIIRWVLQNVFRIPTATTNNELNDNQRYADEYERIDGINFNALFSNKVSNYVVSDSNFDIIGENKRVELLNLTGSSLWKKIKKITSMSLGYGGVVIVPFVKKGKIFYTIVPQKNITIDEMTGDLITKLTLLAEKREVNNITSTTSYLRWVNYQIVNNNLIITQKCTDKHGREIEIPDFWKDTQKITSISNVDRVPVGYIKSPMNNRNVNDKYGVPITYGCEETIQEIKETMKQMYREYKLKEVFVGADITMFDGKNALPSNGLWKKIDSGRDDFFEVFDPQFRDFNNRLEELYRRLESEVGCSAGIISKVETSNATATEIKRRMYETFNLVDDMRSNIEKGLNDFIYSCNILANAYNLSPNGDYELYFDWSYELISDTQQEFNQLMQGVSQDVISKAELRNFIKPDETMKESEKAVKEIEDSMPDVEKMIGDEENGL